MASDPLKSGNVLKHMAEALPTHAKEDTNSDLSSSYEAIALFAHACMTAVEFRLLGFGEGQKIAEECQRLAPRLSPQWNSSFGSHTFLYAHSQSSMQYVVKVDRLGGKAEIRGMGLGDEKINRFEITAKDFISSSALPLRISKGPDGEEDRSDLTAKLKEVFVSESRIQDLASLFKVAIIQKLMPKLYKDGYEEAADEVGSAERERVRDGREDDYARRQQGAHPLMADPAPLPARPHNPRAMPEPMPGFENEHEIGVGPYVSPLRGAPPIIGADDLNPFGRDSFLRDDGILRPNPHRGMYMSPNDLLGDRGGRLSEYGDEVPEGARWSPPVAGLRMPRGSGGFPGRGIWGDPPDQFAEYQGDR